ncbi:MAG: twin-arginine translocase TatA/TatE family subunit [Bacteroidota bacterium]
MPNLMFISGPEIVVIFVFILLLFGSKKIPEVAKGLGKGLKEFKKATEDIKREINESSSDVMKDVDDFNNKLR